VAGDRRAAEKLRLTIVLAGIQGHDIREVALFLDVPGRHGEVAALSRAQTVEGAIVMDGLNDPSLDREIESLLATEPSPSSGARADARVPRSRSRHGGARSWVVAMAARWQWRSSR
jgi:hypothetical protein